MTVPLETTAEALEIVTGSRGNAAETLGIVTESLGTAAKTLGIVAETLGILHYRRHRTRRWGHIITLWNEPWNQPCRG